MKKFLVKGINKEEKNFAIVVNAETENDARKVNVGDDLIKCVDSVEETFVSLGTQFFAKDKNGRETEWEVIELTPEGYFILFPMNNTLEESKNDFEKLKKNNPFYDCGKFEEFAKITVELEWFNQRQITLI